MRILIIGGTGFIGPAVTSWLGRMRHDVALFHRGRTRIQLPDGVAEILGERRNLPTLAGEFHRFAPHVVLDMFPMSEHDARAVMETFGGVAQRVVAISSQDVYRAYGRLTGLEPGPPERLPLTEDAPLRQQLYPYRGDHPRSEADPQRWLDDYDKILVERVVMGDPRLPGTILRLPMVYGPRDRQHRWFEVLKRMDDHRPAILLGAGRAEWRWTRGYVENVAAAIARAVVDERAAGRIYNVGEIEALPEARWVRELAAAAGWRGDVVIVPDDRVPPHLATTMNTAQHLVVDTTRIRRELGYAEPVPRDQALVRTVVWERAHPPPHIDPAAFDYAAEDAILAGRPSWPEERSEI
jgi:nucleoside-diphosphate-sugar epimerase